MRGIERQEMLICEQYPTRRWTARSFCNNLQLAQNPRVQDQTGHSRWAIGRNMEETVHRFAVVDETGS